MFELEPNALRALCRYYLAKRKLKRHENDLKRSLKSINFGTRAGAKRRKRKKLLANGDFETLDEVRAESVPAPTAGSGDKTVSKGMRIV